MIGIGGIGMSSLALFLKSQGKAVAGYDRVASYLTETMSEKGVSIHFDIDPAQIPIEFRDKEKTLVVYTPAIPKDHGELMYFLENDFEVVKRSELLGRVTRETTCLAVAGTHGKTTTSVILAHIMTEAGSGATAFLGGVSLNYHSNLILGTKALTIVEADEFDRSFLRLSPNIACITSLDPDHLDIYGDRQTMEQTYHEFSELVTDTLIVRKGIPIDGLTYGIEDGSDYEAQNLRLEAGKYRFDIKTPSEVLHDLTIALPGRHNVLNTVAALAMADCYGVDHKVIAGALLSFKGILRRFSYAVDAEDLVLIDDYAHHPSEVNAVAESLREMYPDDRILGVFQPHLYSRTRDFGPEFAKSLERFDELILLDIYPARELPIPGIDSDWLLSLIMLKNKRISSKDRLSEYIGASEARIVAMLGAGDIGELVPIISKELGYA
jgi:UDP-N-acetylmuramate--alanine ligase